MTGNRIPDGLANLPPDQVAGHFDQAMTAVVDSEGAVRGAPVDGAIGAEGPAQALSPEAVAVIHEGAARPRRRLPHRRKTVAVKIRHDDVDYTVNFGVDPADGSIVEMFLDGSGKAGPMQAVLDDGTVRRVMVDAPAVSDPAKALLDDAAAIISLALQSGVPLAAMVSIVGMRIGDPGNGFASIIGAALGEAVKLARQPMLL